MAQIREIKRRIKSITNTSKVTHAMELVAAAKMRKAQEAALASRPYTNTLNQILEEVREKTSLPADMAKEQTHNLFGKHQSPTNLIIIITTDRGLVGGLNLNLFREISQISGNLQFITVGKKGTSFAAKTNSEIIASFNSDEKSSIDLARVLTKIAIDSFVSAQFETIKILYPDFQSTIKQIPTITQLLPIVFDENNQKSQPKADPPLAETISNQKSPDLLFEPSADKILNDILPHYVFTRIYQVLLEAKASEHSSRMVAMKNATDSANDLVTDLTLAYNQARQEAITEELLDIVTAQKAFE